MTLNLIWFILLFVLLAGYAILDGFDLGVGVLSLFTRDGHEKRIHMNAIGPVWDGNEVWLITAGGALFAAFPNVYATVFSGFYIALMLLLVALIARAVSMEFRSKVIHPTWQRVWDWCFGLGSLLPPILFGVAFGNVLRGIAVNADGVYVGGFFALLNPFSVVVGVLTLVLFMTHGALYLLLKTDGKLEARIRKMVVPLFTWTVSLYFFATFYATREAPNLFLGILDNPLLYVLAAMVLFSLLAVPILHVGRHDFSAFVASSAAIGAMIGLAAMSMWPVLVPSTLNPNWSLTATKDSSSYLTLKVMFILACIGVPLVLGYTVWVYRLFKGKVQIGHESY